MADKIFFKDLPLNIGVNSQGDISEVINADSIKQSIRMIIDTARGSRIFLPDYGCKIRSFLFEPFDETTARRIGEELQYTIQNHEKRIQIITLNVDMDFDTNEYDINVVYRILTTNQVESVDVTLERL